jgi:hypothetical protein
MTIARVRNSIASALWAHGRRVSRENKRGNLELGSIVKANGKIKVKWDSGQTSYYDEVNWLISV